MLYRRVSTTNYIGVNYIKVLIGFELILLLCNMYKFIIVDIITTNIFQ